MQFKSEPPNYEEDENGLVGVTADVAAGAGVEPGDTVVGQDDETSDNKQDDESSESTESTQATSASQPAPSSDEM